MIDVNGFKVWLVNNTTYSPAVIGDMVSRAKRADGILPFENEEMYLYKLEQITSFADLSVSVKSQLRRAVKLYQEYIGKNV